jgi:hypothetical protein
MHKINTKLSNSRTVSGEMSSQSHSFWCSVVSMHFICDVVLTYFLPPYLFLGGVIFSGADKFMSKDPCSSRCTINKFSWYDCKKWRSFLLVLFDVSRFACRNNCSQRLELMYLERREDTYHHAFRFLLI